LIQSQLPDYLEITSVSVRNTSDSLWIDSPEYVGIENFVLFPHVAQPPTSQKE